MYTVSAGESLEEWKRTLEGHEKQDLFYQREYLNLCRMLGDGVPELFSYRGRNGEQVSYAYLKRPIAHQESRGYDIITPSYGYGGPLYEKADPGLLIDFRKAFEAYCQEEGIIAEFIRFHPVLGNHRYLGDQMEISYNRDTVYIDLTKKAEEIIACYHQNHRRNIRKACRYPFKFQVITKEEALQAAPEFYEIYTETMDKVHASQYAYFSLGYIQQILTDFPEQAVIAAVYCEGEMAAAALCMYEGGILHYHLGCSRKKYLLAGVNPYMLHHTALWGKGTGLAKFHLGGGHNGRDSLFQFKFRFNKEGALPFYIGKKIHDPDQYWWLVNQWAADHGQASNRDYFPAYRAIPDREPARNG